MTWIQTFTGKRFDLLNPQPEMVCTEDIAHHLSLLNRFTGATRFPYSVAQHSVLMSHIVPPELAKAALLHDAHEAYVGDVSAPLKGAMAEASYVHHATQSPYGWINSMAYWTVQSAFGCSVSDDERGVVKRADLAMLQAERRALLGEPPEDWGLEVEAAEVEVVDWLCWRQAKRAFLERAEELGVRAMQGGAG
jgi:hypothetical protein